MRGRKREFTDLFLDLLFEESMGKFKVTHMTYGKQADGLISVEMVGFQDG